MKKRLAFAALLPAILFSFLSFLPDHEGWRLKVDNILLEQAASGHAVEFLVVLQEQADVSGARLLRSKEEKGAYVFERLRATAVRSQGPLLNTAREAGAPHRSFFIVNAILVKGELPLLRRLAEHPAVARIEPNPWVRMEQPFEQSAEALNWRSAIEWGIQRIGADQVWAMGYTGQGVVIGGQDTGYEWTHPAIRDQYRGWNGESADHNYHWHDAIREISPMHGDTAILPPPNPCGLSAAAPCDDHNHGTHTMGTMVGDDGQGNQVGVAPGARWIACRNMERGYGTPATYIECFEWFLAPTNLEGENPNTALAPHVINNSWSCPAIEGCNASNWATMEAVVANLKAAGIVVVVSAGNSGSSCGSVNAPAAMFEPSFSVGATRSSDTIANFSSRGPVTVDGSLRLKPNVAAPGVGVRSAIRNGGYVSYSGTSMAGPHVAGLVALLISAKPELAGQVEAIETIIEETAKPMFSAQNCQEFSGMDLPNHVYGHGRVNALAAVERALGIVSSAEEAQAAAAIRIFPNPFGTQVTIQINAASGPVEFEVFAPSGKRVYEARWTGAGPRNETASLDKLPAGVYMYRIRNGETITTGKLVKR